MAQPSVGGIERQTIQPGSVIAFESAELFAKVSGFLKTQGVDIGSRVQIDETLAEISAPEFNRAVDQGQAAVDQADAQVIQAQAGIATAIAQRQASEAAVTQAEAEIDRAAAVRSFREKQYARIKSLFDLKSIDERLVDEKLDEMQAARATEAAARAAVLTAKAEVAAAAAKVEQTRADLSEAKAKVEVEQAALEKAKVFVEYTKIISPYEGVVTKRNFFPGAFIRSAEQGGLVPLLGVSRTDLMRVVVQVPDRDVPYISPGNTAKIQIDALPGDEFKGKVSRMADAEDPETRHHARRDRFAESAEHAPRGHVRPRDDPAEPGFRRPDDSLVGLVGAVDNGKASVFVVQDGVAHRRKIRVGTDNGLRIDVLNGLTTKDRVISRHNGALADGARVQVVAERDGGGKKKENRMNELARVRDACGSLPR